MSPRSQILGFMKNGLIGMYNYRDLHEKVSKMEITIDRWFKGEFSLDKSVLVEYKLKWHAGHILDTGEIFAQARESSWFNGTKL